MAKSTSIQRIDSARLKRFQARILRWFGYASILTFVAGINQAYAEENASNPLAAVTNTDLRAQYFDLDGPERRDYWVDGADMLTPNLKLKYELHYWDTDVTGSSESDWESLHLKPIYFPESMVGKLGSWKYKVAIGGELILDAGNEDKGIGSGSDQVAPFIWSGIRA